MSRIKREIVASGIIGQYNHEWNVVYLYDPKYDSGCYDLYIKTPDDRGKETFDNIGSYESVVEALAALVNEFSE